MPVPKGGGFGIQSLIIKRDALIAKHVARLVLSLYSLWSLTMKARCGLRSIGKEVQVD